MFLARLQPGSTRDRVRRGTVALWLIALLPVLAAAMTLAIEVAAANHRQVELQLAADAAALAAANGESPYQVIDGSMVTVFDPLLTNRMDRYDLILAEARAAGARYAFLNPVSGTGLTLASNPTNDPSGELVLGTMDSPFFSAFDANLPMTYDLFAPSVNGVRVQVIRNDVLATASAYVDHDVIGFKVRGQTETFVTGTPAIPLLPLAILTDYTPGMGHPVSGSWEQSVQSALGQSSFPMGTLDDFGLDASQLPNNTPDGIPEISVTFNGAGNQNGQILSIGTSGAFSQLTTGITDGDLARYANGMDANSLAIADPDFGQNQLTLYNGTDNQKSFVRVSPTATQLDSLFTDLGTILGRRRVVALYDTLPMGKANLVGFVAVRVMNVDRAVMMGVTQSVTVRFQPTTLRTITAITDHTRRELGPRTVNGIESIFNPYVMRVRTVN